MFTHPSEFIREEEKSNKHAYPGGSDKYYEDKIAFESSAEGFKMRQARIMIPVCLIAIGLLVYWLTGN